MGSEVAVGVNKGRVLTAVLRAATARVTQGTKIVQVRGESFTLAASLVRDIGLALGVSQALVKQAIEDGAQSGVLRVTRDADSGEVVALRADPL